jgi:hypothetical protein
MLAETCNMKFRRLENIYEMICESRIMYDIDLWILDEAWKETDRITKMCTEWLGGNGARERQQEGKTMWRANNYWELIIRMDIPDSVRQ